MRKSLAGFGLMLAAAGLPVLAQNHLGDGRGLERRLEISAPSQRMNANEAWRRELQFRDAIVTGNAPGGLSFRGDTAYRSSREFDGDLGSNDLFSFQRDSLYSGLSGHGLRATDALQYQMALTTGGRAPAGIIGSPLVYQGGGVSRGFEALSRPEGMQTQGDALRRDPDWAGADPYAGAGSLMGALRSSSAYVTSRSSQPLMMQEQRDLADNPLGMTASGLGSIRLVPLSNPDRVNALDARTGLAGAETGSAPRTSYDLIREFLRDEASTQGDAVMAEWERELEQLRAELRAQQAAPALLPLERPGADAAPGDPSLSDEEVEAPLGYEGLEPATIEFIRRGRMPIDSFIGPLPEGQRFDAYAEHMRIGEHLLGEGRYFDAEERFTRALAARPDDPVAMIARAHTQLGAGLFRSAATNLREAIMRHPELVGARYIGSTLPRPARLAELARELKSNLGGGAGNAPTRLERESALLLAYIAYQTGDAAMGAEALDLLAESDAPADRAFIQLLRGVWLDPPEPEGEGGGAGG